MRNEYSGMIAFLVKIHRQIEMHVDDVRPHARRSTRASIESLDFITVPAAARQR